MRGQRGNSYGVRFPDGGRVVIVWNTMFERPRLLKVFEYLPGWHSGD